MNTYLEQHLVRERLDEARARAAQWAMVQGFRPVRRPVRVRAGVLLIRAGRWLAHTAPKRAGEPGRVTA